MPAHRLYDWSSVDWARRTTDIARDMGVTPGSVSNARRKYDPNPKRRWTQYDWSAVDWTMRTIDIARALGCDPNLVSLHRRKLAPSTQQPRHEQVDWAAVDWTLRTKDIAARLDVDAEYVSRMRAILSPESRGAYRGRGRPKSPGGALVMLPWRVPAEARQHVLALAQATGREPGQVLAEALAALPMPVEDPEGL